MEDRGDGIEIQGDMRQFSMWNEGLEYLSKLGFV
jgi:hypothetical protein